MRLLGITKANDGKHKYVATFEDENDKVHKVKFGALGYSDFTKHHDIERKKRYIERHQSREDWSSAGILTPGWNSRWFLWNKPTLEESVKYTIKKFHLE
jgi:Family of unknown function (DUF5754)